MQYNVGSGSLFVTPAGANPTPVVFGALQEFSVDLSFNIKELYGRYQFPLTVARTIAKCTGKAKQAQIRSRLFNEAFFQQTLATGQVATAIDEAGTIPGTPYQITVTNSATWTADLGVYYTVTGLPLRRVAAAPATGEYSVAAGVYTFAAADTTLAVKINYQYTIASPGSKIVVANQLIGQATTFSVQFSMTYNSQQFNINMHAAVSTKLSFGSKLEDFIMPDFDMSFFVDSSNNLCTISAAETN